MPVTRPTPNSGSSHLVLPDGDCGADRPPARSSSPMPSTQETLLLQGSARSCLNCCKRCLNELEEWSKKLPPDVRRPDSTPPARALRSMQTGQNSIAPENSLPQLGQVRCGCVFMGLIALRPQSEPKSNTTFHRVVRIRPARLRAYYFSVA